MTLKQGGNLNTDSVATTTTVEINDATATTLVASRPTRIYLAISMNGGSAEELVFLRFYAAATDNIKKGIILKRKVIGATSVNDTLFIMDSNSMYTGEISAISESGTFDVHITEF